MNETTQPLCHSSGHTGLTLTSAVVYQVLVPSGFPPVAVQLLFLPMSQRPAAGGLKADVRGSECR